MRLSVQRQILLLSYVMLGFLACGALLDSISNAIELITPMGTYIGTIAIVAGWLVAEIVLRRRSLDWRTNQGTWLRIKGVGIKLQLILLGAVILVWMPRLSDFMILGVDSSSREERELGESDEALRLEIERLSREVELQGKINRDQARLILERLEVQQKTLAREIPLTRDGVRNSERRAETLSSSTREIGESIGRAVGDEDLKARIAALERRDQDLTSLLKVARQIAEDGNPEALRTLLSSEEGTFAVGEITSAGASSVYLRGEQGKFLKDAGKVFETGVPNSLSSRRWDFGNAECVDGLGTCLSLEVAGVNESNAQIQWHLGRESRWADSLLLANRAQLATVAAAFTGPVCAFYEGLFGHAPRASSLKPLSLRALLPRPSYYPVEGSGQGNWAVVSHKR